MMRRNLLAGLALAAADPSAATPAPDNNDTRASLYIPRAHQVEDRALLDGFMDEYAFADLVTAAPAIRITHIPVLLDRSAGPHGTLYGHIARNNPQAHAFDGKQTAVIVFHGTHAYISPSWYERKQAVPTWNFAAVHASGVPRPITGREELRALVTRLVNKFEARYTGSGYDFAALPASFIDGMLGGITGFEMPIDQLEGKFKLGQERGEADQASLVSHLAAAREGRSIGELTRDFYAWVKKKASR